MCDRVLNTPLILTPLIKYNVKFSKGRSEYCERKQKIKEFDERNTGTWVRICLLASNKEQKQQSAALL